MLVTGFFFIVLLALLFALVNGFIDGGGLVSTVVMTRTMDPLPAVLLVAGCEIAGIFILGQAVVRTVGSQLVRFPVGASGVTVLAVVLAALLGAIAWNLAMWRIGFPSSSSHALLGGMAGAALAAYGTQGLHWVVFTRVFILLGLVPVIAVLLSFILVKASYWLGEFLTPAAGRILQKTQVAALAGMAMAHGSNDGQKALGIIVLASVVMRPLHSPMPTVPVWAMAISGMALALGVIFGSQRTLQTVGRGMYRVQSLQGVCAESSALALVGMSSLAGYPMSMTHVMSTSVLGAGVAVQPRGVRWTLVSDIALAWLSTIPAAAAVAALWVGLFRICHVVP